MIAVQLEVDVTSPTPHYEQIRSQIQRYVLTGALGPGTRLPPIRQLASHLGLSNGVVARAYHELEREGVVTTGGKRGTIVAPIIDRSGADDPRRGRVLADAAAQYASVAHALGFDLEEAVLALRGAMSVPPTPFAGS